MDRIYIVVRADLSPGLQIAQSCHALRLFAARYPRHDLAWYEGGNNIVVLQVPDETALARLGDELQEDGCLIAEFREPDLDGQATAFAVDESAKRLVRRLPLALAA